MKNANPIRFETPSMSQEAEATYRALYGEGGAGFVQVLRESPYEIAVISCLIAYLEQKRKGCC